MRFGVDNRFDPLGASDVLMFRRTIRAGEPAPCALIGDGTGVYLMRRADLVRPGAPETVYCPLRTPQLARGSIYDDPSPGELPGDVALRASLQKLLSGLRLEGVREVAVHPAPLGLPAVRGLGGILRMVARAGLSLAPDDDFHALGRDGAFVFVRPARSNYPRPCLSLSEGVRACTSFGATTCGLLISTTISSARALTEGPPSSMPTPYTTPPFPRGPRGSARSV